MSASITAALTNARPSQHQASAVNQSGGTVASRDGYGRRTTRPNAWRLSR
jgi:hypothetical protein